MPFVPDFTGARVRASPNFGERRNNRRADLLLLHYTGMETGQAAEDWLCNPASEVSCHYIVHEDGKIVQMVPERLRAWHAGQGSWQGEADVNSFSIGIEVVNPGVMAGCPPFPCGQIEAVRSLALDICRRNHIPPTRVLGHSDTAPGRKIDPGEQFPWHYLAAGGVGLAVPEKASLQNLSPCQQSDPDAVSRLQLHLQTFGYSIKINGVYDGWTKTVVTAFQRHYRPQCVDGNADGETMAILAALMPLENHSLR